MDGGESGQMEEKVHGWVDEKVDGWMEKVDGLEG